MTTENSIHLLQRFQNGDHDAAHQLFARYFNQLDQFAQRRMSPQLQRRIGADDIAQSVYRSFFEKVQHGQFQLKESGEMWKLLAHLAARKIMRKVEWNTADKRAMASERPIDLPEAASPAFALPDQPASDPGAAAALEDAVEFVLCQVCSEWKRILELSHDQLSVPQIAEQINVSGTDVRRVLILRMKCAQQTDNSALANVLNCSEVTVRRLWRDLLETAKRLLADADKE